MWGKIGRLEINMHVVNAISANIILLVTLVSDLFKTSQ